MISIEETKKWLLSNRVDKYGNINLSNLDFSDFDGDICFFGIKTKNNLYQDCQEVNGNLYQCLQKVKGNLDQSLQKVTGIIYQDKEEEKNE